MSVFGPAKAKWKTEIDAYFRANGLVDITNHDFPTLMKAVYDKSFKKSHAVSGFEASGLYPLNREKISDEKLAIGTVFRSNLEAENENETEDTEPADISILIDESFVTPKRSKPSNPIKSVLKSVKTIIETSNKKAADSITISVVKYLHENHLAALKNKQKRKHKAAASSSYILTEDKSREELAKKEEEKIRLVEDKQKRKEARVINKNIKLVAKETAKQNKLEKREANLQLKLANQSKKKPPKTKLLPLLNLTTQSETNIDIEMRDRECSICSIEFNTDSNQMLWISCEAKRCNVWLCSKCFKGSSSSEFYCDLCK